MEQKNIMAIIALSMIAILGVSMVSAYGFSKGFFNKNLSDEEKALLDKEKTDIKTAIENKDFSTWKNLMNQRIAKMQSEITEENFNLIVEEHSHMSEMRKAMDEARISGDYSKVEELRNQYGFFNRPNEGKMGRGMGHRMMKNNSTDLN